jgi:hypothetical protein
MKVKFTMGGLGNQLFMYAFGRSVSKKRDLPLQFWKSRATRDYELEPYGLNIEWIEQPSGPVYDEPGFAFDPGVYMADPDSNFRGYWQTEKYFDEALIRSEIVLKNVSDEIRKQGERLQGETSAFIHVRRGDYLNKGTREFHGVDLEDYYQRAIHYMRTNLSNEPRFYMFSDDPQWCRENFPYPVVVCSTIQEEMYLMSKCRHGIGANSSFSWWANWLGEYPGRICVAPKKWFVKDDLDTRDLIPDRWVTL